MNEYIVKVRIDGYTMVEDPHCPASWRGSGVYDIDWEGHLYADVDVFAHDEEEAMSLAESYEDYVVDEFCDINSVDAVSCSLECTGRDEEELGIGNIHYDDIQWYERPD